MPEVFLRANVFDGHEGGGSKVLPHVRALDSCENMIAACRGVSPLSATLSAIRHVTLLIRGCPCDQEHNATYVLLSIRRLVAGTC